MRTTSAMRMATTTPSPSANPLSAISGVVSVSPSRSSSTRRCASSRGASRAASSPRRVPCAGGSRGRQGARPRLTARQDRAVVHALHPRAPVSQQFHSPAALPQAVRPVHVLGGDEPCSVRHQHLQDDEDETESDVEHDDSERVPPAKALDQGVPQSLNGKRHDAETKRKPEGRAGTK
jgi:hypothetical protein